MVEDIELEIEDEEIEVAPAEPSRFGEPFLNVNTIKPSLNPILVVDGAGLQKVERYFNRIRTRPEDQGGSSLVLDFEWRVTDSPFYRRRARTLQLGDRDEQYVIDLLAFADGDTKKLIHGQGGYRLPTSSFHVDGKLKMYSEDESSYEWAPVNPKTLQPVVDVVRPAFDSADYLKIAHYADAEYTTSKWCLGIWLWNLYDTAHVERLLTNGHVNPLIKDYWGLDDFFRRYFKMQISKDAQKTFDLHSPLTEEQIIYTAIDVRAPWAIKAAQAPKIEHAQVGWTVQIENDAVPAFGDMFINGVWINPEKWTKIMEDNAETERQTLITLGDLFIPLVGRKRHPNPELAEKLKADWKALDNPEPEEEQITALMKAVVGPLAKANPGLKDTLKTRRTELQAERIERKAAAKETYQAEQDFCTKKYQKQFDSYNSEAAINFGSVQQMKDALTSDKAKLQGYYFEEDDLPDMDAKTTLIPFMDQPVISEYVSYKKIIKQRQTYGSRWITTSDVVPPDAKKNQFGFVDPDTGRIHADWRQMGTDTGRPSCTNPNLLNLPSKDDRFKEAFEARPGHLMCDNDCAGQELRILCDYSQEPVWVDAFLNDKDVHSMSARMFRKLLWDENALPDCAFFHDNYKKCRCPVHKKVRDRYKAVTLGVIMGKQKWSLALEMGISPDEAGNLIDEWFAQFAYNKAAIEHNQESAYANGFAVTRSGRRRYAEKVTLEQAIAKARMKYPDGYSKRQFENVLNGIIAAVKRELGNLPYQGGGACLMKMAMGCGADSNGKPFLWHVIRKLEKEHGVDCAMLLNYIYDEFLYECLEGIAQTVGGNNGLVADAIIRAGAELFTIPMASEGAISSFWTK